MAQVFPRRANTVARGTLLGVIILIGGLASLWWIYLRTPLFTNVGKQVPQPVPFSHLVHVNDLGMDCRYCHTTVETSAFAGMPDTKTCMNCHSRVLANDPRLEPIRQSFQTGQAMKWNTVNDLPDFVFFNHSIHINKGIGCSSCHGRDDLTPLMAKGQSLQMGFCVNCHTHPEEQVRPREEVFNMAWQQPANQIQLGTQLVQQYQIQSKLSCSTCHR
jgi:Cytochrome c7 and related cytochrome c